MISVEKIRGYCSKKAKDEHDKREAAGHKWSQAERVISLAREAAYLDVAVYCDGA